MITSTVTNWLAGRGSDCAGGGAGGGGDQWSGGGGGAGAGRISLPHWLLTAALWQLQDISHFLPRLLPACPPSPRTSEPSSGGPTNTLGLTGGAWLQTDNITSNWQHTDHHQAGRGRACYHRQREREINSEIHESLFCSRFHDKYVYHSNNVKINQMWSQYHEVSRKINTIIDN